MLFTLSTVLFVAIATTLYFNFAPQLGGSPSEDTRQRMEAFPHYKEGTFRNTIPTHMSMSAGKMLPLLWRSLKGEGAISPDKPLQVHPFVPEDTAALPSETIGITWFGHSSILLQMDSATFLIDPIFSERASMFSFLGPKRFDFSHYMTPAQLPKVDAVVISHDHYDHLDYETILQLKERVHKYYVPLGVAAHLQAWGIPQEEIVEMQWWEETSFSEHITLACTPSRHFSGRGLSNRNSTLWASWSFLGKSKRVFFSGDSGYTPEFKKIGERYGPFDFAMVECGQYNEQWQVIHMMPEETAQAAADVQAQLMMPIHWGKFPLAFHPWYESPERMIAQANKLGVGFMLPEIGRTYQLNAETPTYPWWNAFK